MNTKINRSKCKKTVKDVNISIKMSEQAFYDLAIQKYTLIKLVVNASLEAKESEHLVGIMNLIDSIQDQAVEQGWNEKVVFPIQ